MASRVGNSGPTSASHKLGWRTPTNIYRFMALQMSSILYWGCRTGLGSSSDSWHLDSRKAAKPERGQPGNGHLNGVAPRNEVSGTWCCRTSMTPVLCPAHPSCSRKCASQSRPGVRAACDSSKQSWIQVGHLCALWHLSSTLFFHAWL